MIARTPQPPYFAVIFTSIKSPNDNGYSEMATRMVKLATEQQGFLGMEAARELIGITVSYWDSLEAIKNWKQNAEHLLAQEKGKSIWYSSFKVRISKVKHDYGFEI